MPCTSCTRLFVLGLVWIGTWAAAQDVIVLTVAYCPDAFTGAGATVAVDSLTGRWDILARFPWPDAVFGCVADFDPIVAASDTHTFLDLTESGGVMLSLDIDTGKMQMTTPTDPFFAGFTTFYVNHSVAWGLGPTVTGDGFCVDGCFQFGALAQADGSWTRLSTVPFTSLMSDANLVDHTAQRMWVQGSYDLRDTPCAPHRSDLCLLTIDTASGALLGSTYSNGTVVYAWGPTVDAQGRRLVWLEGFDDVCQHPFNNFGFGFMDLSTSIATLQACIPSNVTIFDEFVAGFSADGRLLATASGPSPPHLSVFRTADGSVQLNVPLTDLGPKLGAFQDMVWVWAVDVRTPSAGTAAAPTSPSTRVKRSRKRLA